MKRKDQKTAGKYASRVHRELAHQSLVEIFRFLEDGIPRDWQLQEPEKRVIKVQEAFRNILADTLNNRPPSDTNMQTLNECLNLRGEVRYEIRDQIVPESSGSFEHRPVIEFRPKTEYYFKQIAERMKRCLTEFRRHLSFPDSGGKPPLLTFCANPDCGKIFLRSKSHQRCCSRPCTNRVDYLRRKQEKPRYYAERSRKVYHSEGARRKRKIA